MDLKWEQATIRGLGWSDKEELLIVSEDGTVRRYLGLDGEFTSFSLGNVSNQVFHKDARLIIP